MVSYKTLNLESGMPTAAAACNHLLQALAMARAERRSALKLIHGYGSSGKGGAIKREVHMLLQKKKQQGAIREFVPGEDFSPFYDSARRAVDICPELSRDRDYSRQNGGITIVVL